MSGFHGAFATGVACQQGMLTTPDTWFRPLCGGLACALIVETVSPTLHRLNDLPKLTFTELRGFHGAFATGVACQQGALTLPDTWFRPPLWDLLMLQLLRPNSSNLLCLYSTFHLEYPLVLSRFCSLHQDLSGCNIGFDHMTWSWPLTYFRKKTWTWPLIFLFQETVLLCLARVVY